MRKNTENKFSFVIVVIKIKKDNIQEINIKIFKTEQIN